MLSKSVYFTARLFRSSWLDARVVENRGGSRVRDLPKSLRPKEELVCTPHHEDGAQKTESRW